MLLDPVLIKDTLIKDFQSFHDNEFGDLVMKISFCVARGAILFDWFINFFNSD